MKPSDPRLGRQGRPLANACVPDPSSGTAQPVKHDNSGASSCVGPSVRTADGLSQVGVQEEVGETGPQPPCSAASTNLPCKPNPVMCLMLTFYCCSEAAATLYAHTSRMPLKTPTMAANPYFFCGTRSALVCDCTHNSMQTVASPCLHR